jgi:membrane protein YdbS with pleckstrin-like domain
MSSNMPRLSGEVTSLLINGAQADLDFLRFMFCHNCGNKTSTDSRHCAYCGALKIVSIADLVRAGSQRITGWSSYKESAPVEPEQCIFKIRPAFHTVGLNYLFAALITIFTTVLIAYLGGSLAAVSASLLAYFSVPFYQHLKRNTMVYTLTTSKLEIESGLFSKTNQRLFLQHINHISVSESLAERLLGVGSVWIDSAGMGDKIMLKNIRHPRQYAHLITTQLQRWKQS